MKHLPDFLDLEMHELQSVTDQPDLFILQTACEFNQWEYSGNYPEYLVEKWIQVNPHSDGTAYYRLLNSRTHKQLNPLTLRTFQDAIREELEHINQHKTDHQAFLKTLYQTFQILSEDPDSQEPISLVAIYAHLSQNRKTFRRELFGLDLNRLLAAQQLELAHKVLVVYPGGSPAKSFHIYDEEHGLHQVGAISFEDIQTVISEDEYSDAEGFSANVLEFFA